jgi:hypothetical protein
MKKHKRSGTPSDHLRVTFLRPNALRLIPGEVAKHLRFPAQPKVQIPPISICTESRKGMQSLEPQLELLLVGS